MGDFLIFNFNELSSVLLLYFVHALLFTGLIWRKAVEQSKLEAKWLALFIFLGALYISPFMLGYANWYSVKHLREFLFFVPFQQLFLIGPVFYFYVRSLLDKSPFSKLDYLHFLPAALYLLYSLMVYVWDVWVLDEFYFYADGQDKDLDFWYQMAGLISMLFYLLLSFRHHRAYRLRSQDELSYADEIAFKWIQHFSIAFALILLLRVFFFILNPEWGEFGRKFWYYLCFSILLSYIALSGYFQLVKSGLKLQFAIPEPDKLPAEEDKFKTEEEAKSEDFEEWKDKLGQLFQEDKLHERPNLTLNDLALTLNTNRNIVSKLINQEFQMNFNDFVNQQRAEAVIRKLKEGAHHKNTLLGIAFDCGFNSKTTFNRAFKKYTGLSPLQYIQAQQL